MADAKYYTVVFKFAGQYDVDALKSVFDSALDWYRYAPNFWILWSTKTAEEWYAVIKPKVKEGDHFFICELATGNRQGWMARDFWDWLNKDGRG
jgi:hypothetical protein